MADLKTLFIRESVAVQSLYLALFLGSYESESAPYADGFNTPMYGRLRYFSA
jgi:hypothetical protein